ncbi:hypothetical protein PFMC_00092 [Plasmodium falciparum CAMP/Malaysia]|uniref:Uncharacterized protein n=1 Tax=Plasmodium falciparum (isolate Camp / Malaysia) TaxID=5835 RepID=A0A024XF14_PLAFC|nr:hypothetical protein PFMC_00092 [Plasmodium falciparum CAMP/Malaysia]
MYNILDEHLYVIFICLIFFITKKKIIRLYIIIMNNIFYKRNVLHINKNNKRHNIYKGFIKYIK